MKAYIDKSALIAEIERRKKYYENIQMIKPVYESNIEDFNELLSFLDTLEVKEAEEEPVSNDLEEVSKQYALNNSPWEDCVSEVQDAFIAGAKWQKEQMEKNRIEHCDNITEEQYNLETGFLDSFLDKNKRMPTFLDAIEYGMQKAQKGG